VLRAKPLASADTAERGDELRDLRRLSSHSNLSVRKLRDCINAPVDPLPAYKVGGKILVRLSEFDRWMARRRYSAPTVDVIVDDVLRELTGRTA
jgi:hypothetical protein